ncbi:MAG: hypothetical protein KDJ45_06965 [Hyphomicrobiaceae bacterium]|nr:hypothetical protein [Hyphomicrobiaceae bacterium]MCC0009925.1 hypothetical protein [Hyphomicrobiaceae bacterium]
MSKTGAKAAGSGVLLVMMAAMVLMSAQPSYAENKQLSEKSVKTFMEYAWSLVPAQFTKPNGEIVQVDKKKKNEVLVPVDVAREVIRVGRISAHAQVCDLSQAQVANYRSLMQRESDKKKWSEQQMIYINQLHLTTVMLLTGKIKLVEKQGDKQVVVEERKSPVQTCAPEYKEKVAQVIADYVSKGPPISTAMEMPGAPDAKTAADVKTEPAQKK